MTIQISKILAMWLIAIVLALGTVSIPAPAQAATDNPSTGSAGYFQMQWHFDTQLGPSVTDKARWKMPWPARLIDIKCSARLLGGSASPTYIFRLKEAGVSSATCQPTAASTEVQGTITDPTIADEAVMTLDYETPTGTNPTADDVDVILIFKRQ